MRIRNIFVDSKLSPGTFFVLVCAVYIALGCFIDGVSMIVLTLPILFPSVKVMGFDPIWFGVVLVILIEVGQLTPPVGLNLVAIQSISGGRPIEEVTAGAVPFILLLTAGLVLLYVLPDLALALPGRMP